MINQSALKSFYLLLFALFFTYGKTFTSHISKHPEYNDIARILNFLPIDHNYIYPTFFLLSMVTFILTAINPTPGLRRLSFISLLFLYDMKYSFGVRHHSGLISIYFAGWLCLPNKVLLNSKNTIKALCAILFSIYFNAGIWKLKTLVSHHEEGSFFDLLARLAEPPLVYNWNIHPLSHFLFGHSYLLSRSILIFGMFFVLLFQLTTFLPIVFHRLRKTYLILCICFHFSLGTLTGTWFLNQIIACLWIWIFLINTPQSCDVHRDEYG